jgi:prepilin-type N-terminal cleavage/methylation domain-containing protein
MIDRAHSRGRRAGFTLLETLLALVVGSVIALLAHEIFRATVDARQHLLAASAGDDLRAQGRRWLSSAFRSARVGSEAPFDGHASEAVFTTSLLAVSGSPEPARVSLHIGPGGLELTGGPGATIMLDRSATALRLDYLLELGADARWTTAWLSPVSAPTAIRLRVRRPSTDGDTIDTLLFLIQGGS